MSWPEEAKDNMKQQLLSLVQQADSGGCSRPALSGRSARHGDGAPCLQPRQWIARVSIIVCLLSAVVSCLAENVEPLTLADRVRQADVIAMADVREVKVQTLNENFEYQYVTCTLTNRLKGKTVNNPTDVVLALKLKQEPPPDRLLSNQSYLVFLVGDWSLAPVSPVGSIVPVADVNEKMLAKIRQLVKDGSFIQYVSLTVHMAGGWSANTKIHAGGKVTGGHMSGGPAPFHHMDEGVLGGAALSNVIAQAEKVFRSPVPSQPSISTNDLVYITIETFDRETKTYQRPRQGIFADRDLVELDKLLHQHRIGAW
jgi:hypothetical protein